ncbi:MAG: sigma-70 family RNA polymerase sigma factor [Bacteroidales bacterium]|nr:sigma-70 family RNA polymerase sigma factor [Bacteroidales bacterium]
MDNTLKLFSLLINEDNQNMTLEEISDSYKIDNNSDLFASAFIKTYKLILKISKRYYGLTQEDIISFSLEKLNYCLLNYRRGGAKFSTYYAKVLINKFREETQALNTHKRKIIFYSDSYEVILEKGFDLIDQKQITDNSLQCLNNFNLTLRELLYCQLLGKNYTNREISEFLGLSIMTLSNTRKDLREKLSSLL